MCNMDWRVRAIRHRLGGLSIHKAYNFKTGVGNSTGKGMRKGCPWNKDELFLDMEAIIDEWYSDNKKKKMLGTYLQF